MRYVPLIFLLFILSASNAQKLKRITNKSKTPPGFIERYEVLESDPSIRHGDYEKDYDGRLIVRGQYTNGVKSGAWTYWRHGKIVQKIDFDKHEVVYSNDPPTAPPIESWFIKGDSLIKNNTDNKPIIEGGAWRFYMYALVCLRYPPEARRSGTQGDVKISATVTEKGELIDEKIESGPGMGCDEEALRVVKLLPDDWLPVYIDGKPVPMRVVIPLRFKLEY